MEYNNNKGFVNSTTDSDIDMDSENGLRVSDNSQIAQLDANTLATVAARECPAISAINIDKSSGVHIGPKIVTVVQNVDNNEKVKDLPLPRYLVSVVKNTSRAERIACIISLIVLAVCISLIVYFVKLSRPIEEVDVAPHPWNITRDMWLATPYNSSTDIKEGLQIRLVIINHSMGSECHSFRVCAAELRNLQGYFLCKVGWDIPYNFLVGNDGRIYEGRGWNKVGAHTISYNNCTLGIGFIGDYRATSNTHSTPTEAQIERLHMLLSSGVKLGYLHPNYVIVGGKDINLNSESPGSNLYNEMKRWAHYDSERYRNLTCNQIMEGRERNL